MRSIRLFLADDHDLFRAGVRMVLEAQSDLQVVGEAGDAHSIVARVTEQSPDVALIDLCLPGSGLKAMVRIRQNCPNTRMLALTMRDESAYLRAVMAAGGAGYVVKSATTAELMDAVRTVHAGRVYIDHRVKDAFVPNGASQAALARVRADLSERERDSLVLLAQGYTNQKVADQLHISIKSVETYRRRIASKLGLRDRADLIRYALDSGLLSAEGASSTIMSG